MAFISMNSLGAKWLRRDNFKQVLYFQVYYTSSPPGPDATRR